MFEQWDIIVNSRSKKRMGRDAPQWKIEKVRDGRLGVTNPRLGWRWIENPENYELVCKPLEWTALMGAGGIEE